MLVDAWERRGPLAWLLLPIALLFGLLVAMRRSAYRLGLFRVRKVKCVVIVVGNVIAGGAGKTPTTIAIVQHLRQRGIQVGVVSRGYGRTGTGTCAVSENDDATAVGDEPLLIARATAVPVWVGQARHAAALALLEAHPQTQVIVCDDGLQHFPLYRDIEVCVFDDRGAGNGWMLPAGPLRESWPRALVKEVGQIQERELVLHTGSKPAFAGFRATRTLDRSARTRGGDKVPLQAVSAPVLALAGIARPSVFFSELAEAGLPADKTLALQDHFDFGQLNTAQFGGYQVVCTEKDAVKLWKYWPQALAVPLLQTLEPAFLVALDAQVNTALRTKLSFDDGHQTT